jgi:hypothetical protein
MVKPASIDHLAREEALAKIVPFPFIVPQEFVRAVQMIEGDRDIFGIPYDIHPFVVAL